MRKTRVKTNGKRYFHSPTAWIRIKIWNFRNHTCFSCQKFKRLEKSAIFFSDACKTSWSETRKKWNLDLNDYIWLCRDCMSKPQPDQRMKMTKNDWEKSQAYSYVFSEHE